MEIKPFTIRVTNCYQIWIFEILSWHKSDHFVWVEHRLIKLYEWPQRHNNKWLYIWLFFSSSITYILDWLSESHWFPINKMLSNFKSFSLKKKFNNFSNRWNNSLISPILCFKEVISDFLKKWSNLKNVKISKNFNFFIRSKGHKK